LLQDAWNDLSSGAFKVDEEEEEGEEGDGMFLHAHVDPEHPLFAVVM
jgi:hypothetical protein